MLILQVLYFMLPGYCANMAPCLVRNIFPKLAVPIDFNKKIGGKLIFGRNKTYRGLIFGILFGMLTAFLQFLVYKNGLFPNIALVDYSNWLLIGFLMSFGALFGDLAESFVKRRLNLQPGSRFIPFDQTDHVIGALALVSLEVQLTWQIWVTALAATFFLHILINHVGYYLKFRETKW
jgi:CDP-2,3-bis-(O-geranylgeranyl)-sn-glycerol synthase